METFEHIKASLTDDNMVQLDVKLNVAELNKHSLLGSYYNLRRMLIESLFHLIEQGHKNEAKKTLEEINKLFMWETLGVTQGSVEIKDGVLYGLSKNVEIDESLMAKINEK